MTSAPAVASTSRALDEMAALIDRFATAEGMNGTPIPRLKIARATQPGGCVHGVYEPALGIIVQGSKRVMLADEVYIYDRSSFLIASVDLPVSSQVQEASPAKPYLSFKLDLDMREIASLLTQAPLPPRGEQASSRGIFLAVTCEPMLEALLRLLRLLETPEDIPALALDRARGALPVAEERAGWRVAQMSTVHSQAQRIGKAIGWLKQHFAGAAHRLVRARRA